MERNIGNISLISIQQQINGATLEQLQEYAKVLATNDPKTIDDFLFDATHKKHGTKRMELCGHGFKVSACVLALSLDCQYSSYTLVDVLRYGLRDEEGREAIKCRLSEDETSVIFYYEN